jgi:glucosyl-3-phosphoglycerate synthase
MELSVGATVGALRAPSPSLRAAVVVPAHDEEARIGACLEALAEQRSPAAEEYEVIVVLDACNDGTELAVAAAASRWPLLRLQTISGPGRGAGPARALGMDVACARLESVGAGSGLLASTDADTRVAPDWLEQQLLAIGGGARAVGGEIVLDSGEAAVLPVAVIEGRQADLGRRLRAASARGPSEHAHFSGASLGLTPGAYRQAGGLGDLVALEDQDLEDRLAAAGIAIHRPRAVTVTTAARIDGRAERGLARDLELGRWLATRRYRGCDYEVAELVAAKPGPVAAILPARRCAATVGATVERLLPLRSCGLLDRLVVVDAGSDDGTAAIAAAAGAEVVAEASLSPELGPGRGKGDAMWRAAASLEAEILVFLDADSHDFDAGFLTGPLGPLFLEPGLQLVKAAFQRPLALPGGTDENGGGRVTELVARPLLNLHFPSLAGFSQPLAGEIAIRRSLFAQLQVPVGYGVEIAMLIDALRIAGLDALAEVDVGRRQNSHQSLQALGTMAAEIMVAVERRTGASQRPASQPFRPRPDSGAPVLRLRCEERPPFGARERPPSGPG